MGQSDLEKLVLSVDVVVFRIHDKTLQVLLYERDKEPFMKAPSLPGTAIRVDEVLLDAAKRALMDKTAMTRQQVEKIFFEQLATFDGLYRDPRGRTVSVAYIGVTQENAIDGKKIMWKRAVDYIGEALPFDHGLILESAVKRLQGKVRYTNIAKEFIPKHFRIEVLQAVYEAILGCPLNLTNFRNKLLKIGLIEQVDVLKEAVGKKGGRPPHLYRFGHDLLETVDRDFL